jgi:drug/metabolite transporter (DMT)-like permease
MNLLYVVFASILFGIFPSIQKNVMASGVSPIALVIVCNGVAACCSLVICLIQRKEIRISRKQLLSLILIGMFGLFFTDYLLNVAYTLIPVGYVTMIHFFYPTLVCICMVLFFGAKMTRNKWIAIALSIAGLALLAGGSFSGSMTGLAVAGITAVTYSFYMIATDKSPAGEVDPLLRVFYTNLTVMVTALVLSVRMHPVFPFRPALWAQSIFVGAMLCAAIYLLNQGVAKVGAGTASFINMLEPVTSLVVSAVVYRYGISPMAGIGCLLIVVSLFFSAKT